MRLLFVPILFWLLTFGGNPASDQPVPENADTLVLKWNKAYADDTIDKAVIGLRWALSYSGAMLPDAPYAIVADSDQITIRLSDVGFDDQAMQYLVELHQKIKSSAEYQTTKSIDLGRYVALLIGAPEHYYRITGVPENLDGLLAQYELSESKGYVNNSAVSYEHRIIRFSEQQRLKQIFITSEVDSITGQIFEFETIDIMPNGQLRYAVFDANGTRINNANPTHSNAGKPAKCMWCHESIIQPLFTAQKDFTGFLSYLDFKQKLTAENQAFHEQKMALKTGVDFLKTTQNTQTELLYISFMEPSAERLALEWGMPLQQVKTLLAGLPAHVYPEFPFLGNLYDRNAVEPFAPFKGLPVSTHVREASVVEVNHLNHD